MNEKLLLVDDDPSILSLLGSVVKILRLDFETATTGIEAVNKLKKTEFHLVVSDENLPGLKGHEIAEWMRGNDAYRTTPLILITADQNSRLFSELTAKGIITMFIPKPSNINQIQSSIQTVLSLRLAQKREGTVAVNINQDK